MAMEKSLTNSQYEEIFSSVIVPNLTPSFPMDNSPQRAISPKDICSQPTESASIENSQKVRNLPQYDTSDVLSKAEEKLLDQVLSEKKEKVMKKKKKTSSKREDISLHEAIAILKETHTESSMNDSFSIELFDNPLSQPSSQFTHRERLEWLQERRNVGLWVFCDKPGCNKQRWLENVKDPTELPDKWYCEMNPDKAFASCSVPEKGPTVQEDVDLIYNLYNCGSVVWGRVDGFPWWPAMVDDDPDTEQYYWLDGYSDIPTHYHVVFFDSDKVSRCWLAPNAIMAFKTNPDLDKKSKYAKKFQKRLQFSKHQAEEAINLTLRERLAKFSFLARWPHQIITPPDSKKVENIPKNKDITKKPDAKRNNKKTEHKSRDRTKKIDQKTNLSQNNGNSIMEKLLMLCDSVSEDEFSNPKPKNSSIELNFNSDIGWKTRTASETTHIETENSNPKIKNKINAYSEKFKAKIAKKTNTKPHESKTGAQKTKDDSKKIKSSKICAQNSKESSNNLEDILTQVQSDSENLNNSKNVSKELKSSKIDAQNSKDDSKKLKNSSQSSKGDSKQTKASKIDVHDSKENSESTESSKIEDQTVSKSLKTSKTEKSKFSKNKDDLNDSKFDSESSKATSKGYEADSEVSKDHSKYLESDTQNEDPIYEQLKKDVIKSQEKRKKILSQDKNIFEQLKKDVIKSQEKRKKVLSQDKTFEKPKKARNVSPPAQKSLLSTQKSRNISPNAQKSISNTQTVKKSRSLGLRRIKKPNNLKTDSSKDSDTESICSNASTINKVKSLGLSKSSKNSRRIIDSSDNESIVSEAPEKIKKIKMTQRTPKIKLDKHFSSDLAIFPKLDTPPKKLLNDVSKMFTDSDILDNTQVVPGSNNNIDEIIEQLSQETQDFNNNL